MVNEPAGEPLFCHCKALPRGHKHPEGGFFACQCLTHPKLGTLLMLWAHVSLALLLRHPVILPNSHLLLYPSISVKCPKCTSPPCSLISPRTSLCSLPSRLDEIRFKIAFRTLGECFFI